MSHTQRIFDITANRYGGKPHVSQTSLLYIYMYIEWLIDDSISHVELHYLMNGEDRDEKERCRDKK